ncbi:ribonuclease H-like domain-containing protein [Tanacetum coccineum]
MLMLNMALLSMRARKFYQRTGRKIIIDGSSTVGYDKSKVKRSAGANNDDKNLAFLTTSGASNTNNINTVNPEVSTEDLEQLRDDDWKGKMDLKWKNGTTSTRAPRSKDNINWNQGSSSKAVRIEDASKKEMCAIDGAGFDWSDMAEEEIQANMALMAFLDSEVTNDKSCLKNYEALKKQYDDLLVKLDDTSFKASTYKRGLEEYKQPEENTDDYIKQQQKTDSKLCKSPLRLVSYDEDDLRPTLSCPHKAPRAVLMKTGLKTVNTARPVNTVRSVNDSGRAFKYWKNQKEILMLYEIQQGRSNAGGNIIQFKLQKAMDSCRITYKVKEQLVQKIEAIRLFLAYASYMRFKVYQMDVKSAFLYGQIKEEISDRLFDDTLQHQARISCCSVCMCKGTLVILKDSPLEIFAYTTEISGAQQDEEVNN